MNLLDISGLIQFGPPDLFILSLSLPLIALCSYVLYREYS